MKLRLKHFNDILHIDIKQWVFNLFLGHNKKTCYRSESYGISTYRISDYWVELGKKEILIEILKSKNKGIQSYSIEELVAKVSVLEYGQSTILAIYNFDYSSLGRILDRLPGIDSKLFNQDVIFIPCSNVEQARKVQSRLSSDLAYTMIINNGVAMAMHLA